MKEIEKKEEKVEKKEKNEYEDKGRKINLALEYNSF